MSQAQVTPIRPWVTYAVIAANVAMFVVEVALGASPIAPTAQQIFELGGSFPPSTLNGEWWRLGSSMFLHFGVLHLGLNMVCLYQARAVEPMYGRLGFVAIYLAAGLGGGVASLLAATGNVVTAGASGAVFGVFGAFGAFLVLRRALIEPEAWQRTARSLGTFLALNLVVGLTAEHISLSAHIGGFVVGFAAGAALLAGPRAAAQRTVRALAVGALGLGLTAGALVTIDPPLDVGAVLTRFETADQASVARWNAALERARAGQITTPELVEILEREVIAPYEQMRRDVGAVDDVPERLRPLFARVVDYTGARVAAWRAFAAALREPDPAKQKPLLEAYQRDATEITVRLKAYEAEVDRLKP